MRKGLAVFLSTLLCLAALAYAVPHRGLLGSKKSAQARRLTLSISKAGSGSGTVTSSPAGILCGSDCSEPYFAGTLVTITCSPDSGSTCSLSGGGCIGAGPCLVPVSQESVTATFDAEPTPGDVVLLEDFVTQRLSHGGNVLWQVHPDGVQVFSLVDQQFQIVVPLSGSGVCANFSPCIYMEFFPHPYTSPGGFAKFYIKSGTWDPNLNRLTFWIQPNINIVRRADGGQDLTFGTYSKPDDGDPNNQGGHYYHQLAGNMTANRWHKVVLNRHPQHEVGTDPNNDVADNPTAPANQYFDGLTRMYFGDPVSSDTRNSTWLFDDFRFSTVSGEPDFEISTIMGHYTGTRYEVGWNARVNIARTFEVRYKTTSMKPDAFLTGTDGGTVSSPGSAFEAVYWDSPNMAEVQDLYVAMRVQGQTEFSEIHIPSSGPAN